MNGEKVHIDAHCCPLSVDSLNMYLKTKNFISIINMKWEQKKTYLVTPFPCPLNPCCPTDARRFILSMHVVVVMIFSLCSFLVIIVLLHLLLRLRTVQCQLTVNSRYKVRSFGWAVSKNASRCWYCLRAVWAWASARVKQVRLLKTR